MIRVDIMAQVNVSRGSGLTLLSSSLPPVAGTRLRRAP